MNESDIDITLSEKFNRVLSTFEYCAQQLKRLNDKSKSIEKVILSNSSPKQNNIHNILKASTVDKDDDKTQYERLTVVIETVNECCQRLKKLNDKFSQLQSMVSDS